ncbi:hypothetical protein ABE28_008855 [Peribacillus muralis]|uniref:YopX protein domain-containing protein n=1 Tax=Peribacillus muralis TaxID=264697 RepID=A0A1B3XMP7_9BACI|nr:YopX family protein [Peribacillus muralis]AOH54460.1 hypothetical protein ABE28_008855 [Peribacillus muralis]
MREVKYRAWDNVENKMYYPGEEENIHFYFDSSGIVAERFIEEEVCTPEGERGMYGGTEKLEHHKYMQYTGLKDNASEEEHPMEIFESDILFDPVNDEYYIVTWDESYANFFLKNIDDSLGKPDYDFAEYDTDVCDGLYVVGNIHENPELLCDSNVR